jgi:hypothetical protein
MEEARNAATRKADTLAALVQTGADVWVATARTARRGTWRLSNVT